MCTLHLHQQTRKNGQYCVLKTKIRGIIEHLAIDPTGLKVYGDGEWKVKKHSTNGKRRVWRKLYIAVDSHTHEIIGAELSLSSVPDAEVMPNFLKQPHRKICNISGDGASDTRTCHTRFSTHRTSGRSAILVSTSFNLRNGHLQCEAITRW